MSLIHARLRCLSEGPSLQDFKVRAGVAGACGLPFLRSAGIVDATVPKILESLLMHVDIMDSSTSGTNVAAGAFNVEVVIQR